MSSVKSVSSFEQLALDPKIQKALTLCGYEVPTPIQAQSIPTILDHKDLIACAQTGSGKTAAFVLPALQLLCEPDLAKKSRILILTPTRELANQITKAVSTYGKLMKITTAVLVGGMPYHNQIKDLARNPDIIVATPGRLLDHLEQRRVDLSGIEMLVLDEADRMLDMGFIDDVQYIAKLTPNNRQTLLFSATIDKELAKIVNHLMKHPVRLDLSGEKISTPKIQQELYKVSNAQHKTRLLKHFLNEGNIFKAIIFSATKAHADKLAEQLRDDGYAAGALHGDLRQNVRNRTVEQLRSGKIQFLVATDVAARGIDIRDITHVFNYDLPRFSEDYVHRIGRTGRAGKTGIAISFVSPTDTKHLQGIERYIGQRIKVMPSIDMKGSEYQESRERKVLSIDTTHEPSDKSDRPKRPISRDKKRFSKPESGKRGAERGGERKYTERAPARGGERKYAERGAERGERKYSERGAASGERKFSERGAERGERKYGERGAERGERKFSERGAERGERKYGERGAERGERKFSERGAERGERKYGERGAERGERKFSERGAERGERNYGDRGAERGERKYSERGAASGERRFSDKPRKSFRGDKPAVAKRGASEGRDSGKYRPSSIAQPSSSPRSKQGYKKKSESGATTGGWRKKSGGASSSRRGDDERRRG
jgi:superfamily II DNA/RNA helicase